ncbi:MAG: hypothetical protein ACON39_01275 [Coraliomargaritaceae bacterium]
MEILNISFAILLIKLLFCVLPGVGGIYLLSADHEKMRSLRAWICKQLFGVSNAFEYKKFARFIRTIAVLLITFSAVVTWFVLLRGYFK